MKCVLVWTICGGILFVMPDGVGPCEQLAACLKWGFFVLTGQDLVNTWGPSNKLHKKYPGEGQTGNHGLTLFLRVGFNLVQGYNSTDDAVNCRITVINVLTMTWCGAKGNVKFCSSPQWTSTSRRSALSVVDFPTLPKRNAFWGGFQWRFTFQPGSQSSSSFVCCWSH